MSLNEYPNPLGVVTCPSCEKNVPDTLLCVYCGIRLKGEVVIPPLKNKEREILTAMDTLGGVLSIPDIYNSIGGSKESMRMSLSDMVRFGLVDKPSRGKYLISELGKSALIIKEDLDIEIKEPPKHFPVISIEKPEILRTTTVIRIFKRAGGTRMGRDGYFALGSVLEQIGGEIAQEAVAIAGNNNRKTIRAEDMEQAIQMMIPRLQEEAR